MGSLGLPELLFIFVLALLIFGPKRLPEIGRTVGKGMAEFRKASGELKRTINAEMALDENPAPPQIRPHRVEPARAAATASAAAASADTAVDAGGFDGIDDTGRAGATVPEMRVPDTAVPSSALNRPGAVTPDPDPIDPH
jgi:sec-independent protein translocase protein TatA